MAADDVQPQLPALAFGVLPETRRYRLRMARYPALAQSIAAFMEERGEAPLDLLDVGVGRGRTLRFLEAMGLEPRLRLHGLDRAIRPDLYRPDAWELRVGDAERALPYEDASMDVVVFEQVLEHLWDIDTPLREIERVLRPGGLLVLGVPTFPGPLAALRNLALRVFPKAHAASRSQHHQTFSRRSIVRHLRATTSLEVADVRGFRVVSGGLIEFLEDYAWWYRLSLFMARVLPCLCTEVQIVARRPGLSSATITP